LKAILGRYTGTTEVELSLEERAELQNAVAASRENVLRISDELKERVEGLLAADQPQKRLEAESFFIKFIKMGKYGVRVDFNCFLQQPVSEQRRLFPEILKIGMVVATKEVMVDFLQRTALDHNYIFECMIAPSGRYSYYINIEECAKYFRGLTPENSARLSSLLG